MATHTKHTPAGVRKAVGYVRVSTAVQASEGVSLEAQRAAIERYAAGAGIELVCVETDTQTGKRADDRAGLQRAIEQATASRGVLVVFSLSRLARSTRDTLGIAESLERAGADLVSLSERIDTTGACGRMVFRMLAVLAEFERDVVSERTRASLRHKRAGGYKLGGHAPYGYSVDRTADDSKPRLVPNAPEQAAVATMIKMHRAGSSLRNIAKALTEQGVQPRSGSVWHPKVIGGIVGRSEQHHHELAGV